MNHFFYKNGMVIAGGAIQGLGMGLFLFPHSIPSGGAGGLAVLLNHFLFLHMGFALWLVNFSMLVLAIKFLGNRCAIWTMAAISITSLSIYLFQDLFRTPLGNVWVDLCIGSVFLGTGVGLLMREGVSNGGMGVVALIISTSRNTLPGKPLFWINVSIFIITASIISWDLIVQALISQWISTKVVDFVCRLNWHQTYTLAWRKK
ncbi:putative 5xTM membrane YitT family protein [Cytobacillus oceanisediminis]|jgi:uncharacterized membrane-anchored protein YitT (DUF2179 family)|uniref:Putative 5xTM membrane YitT family protein n=1 Tax=Cytobacillus oceanisediminis TaxID=665099 RepID=A0A2V3A592_9BACI|nr:YitT family protein [Cytobacillus oceanisediminis]PWW32183.1 putative 5xTM membrane YitT family protein [Cytobacillus oceanisediminis]